MIPCVGGWGGGGSVSATMAQNGRDALFASPRYLPAVLIIRVVTGKYSRLHMYNAMPCVMYDSGLSIIIIAL